MGIRVGSFSVPKDLPIWINAIQIGFNARVMDWVFQNDGSKGRLDGFVDCCVQGLDVHIIFLKLSLPIEHYP
jgi:hypothetical protein